MNIFAVDEDPKRAARDLCDKHIPKMVIESAQLICTALRKRGIDAVPYKSTHANHPCSIWAAANPNNLLWLWLHFRALCFHYTQRFGRIHLTEIKMRGIEQFIDLTADATQHTPFAQAMPEIYKHANAVQAYRAYYLGEKRRFAKWRLGEPVWWVK